MHTTKKKPARFMQVPQLSSSTVDTYLRNLRAETMNKSPVILKDGQLAEVKQILKQHIPEAKVMVFGSRASGKNLKKHSDLDLLVKTHCPLSIRRLRQLKDAFEDSTLPFTVDVIESTDLAVASDSALLQHATVIFYDNKSSAHQ